jgi:hypothetical protein
MHAYFSLEKRLDERSFFEAKWFAIKIEGQFYYAIRIKDVMLCQSLRAYDHAMLVRIKSKE